MGDKKEKEIFYNNLNIDEMVKQLIKHKSKILDDFAKAYLADSGLKPNEVVLVEQQVTDNGTIKEINYYFKKKDDETVHNS